MLGMQPYAMTYNNIDILSRKRQIMLYVILTVTLLNITLKQGTNHVACQSDLKIFRIKLFLKLVKNNISFKPFTPPPLSLLERDRGKPEVGDIKANANIIKRTLQNFGITVEMDEISIGP